MKHWFVLGALALGGCATSESSSPDAGEGPEKDAGVADARRPADTVFSVGLTNNSGDVPQGAPLVQLKFGEGQTGPGTVVSTRLASAPTLDGRDSEWATVPASEIPLISRGGQIGMSKEDWDREWDAGKGKIPAYDFGIPSVQVKSAYDDQNVYFLLSWADATENRSREQWVLEATGWRRDLSLNEDRAYLAFDIGGSFPSFQVAGCAAACHLKSKMGQYSPPEVLAERFEMHTEGATESADVWHWKATRSDAMAHADDQYWDHDKRRPDGPDDFVVDNKRTLDGGIVIPAFMGPDGVNSNPTALYAPDSGMGPAAIAFDGAGAVVGTRLPGYVSRPASPARADIRAKGRWESGRWTVEFSRQRLTGDTHDAQFPHR